MTFKILSKKQKAVFKWCHGKNKDKYKCILCDGAVRSGKTVCMITSFILWAMRYFNGSTFAICGKTVASCERNIITPMQGIADLKQLYKMTYRRSDHLLTVKSKNKTNYFYVFGGKDESSAALIQGITLAGVLLDEVALMPRSFVEQAIARTITEKNAKYWLNCNPDSPQHYINLEWIEDSKNENVKRIYHLHFLLEDNPTLSPEQIAETKNQFSGIFYRRFILGEWAKAEGLVYPNFIPEKHVIPEFKLRDKAKARFYVSIDYGTLNPCSMGLWAVMHSEKLGDFAIRVKEYYFNSRKEGYQKTDEEYLSELIKLTDGFDINRVIIDPSAASFITTIKKSGRFSVTPANNDVIDGIHHTSNELTAGRLYFCRNCKDSIREFSLYVWDEKATEDRVKKTDDHAMDDIRYFCNTVFTKVSESTVYKYTNITKGGWE